MFNSEDQLHDELYQYFSYIENSSKEIINRRESLSRNDSNWYQYCYNNPLSYVDSDGREGGEGTALWFETMWWLTVIDGPAPVGDIVYVVGGALVFWAENANNLAAISDWVRNAGDAAKDKTGKSNGGSGKDSDSNSPSPKGLVGMTKEMATYSEMRRDTSTPPLKPPRTPGKIFS